jgi:hypothetical protein
MGFQRTVQRPISLRIAEPHFWWPLVGSQRILEGNGLLIRENPEAGPHGALDWARYKLLEAALTNGGYVRLLGSKQGSRAGRWSRVRVEEERPKGSGKRGGKRGREEEAK